MSISRKVALASVVAALSFSVLASACATSSPNMSVHPVEMTHVVKPEPMDVNSVGHVDRPAEAVKRLSAERKAVESSIDAGKDSSASQANLKGAKQRPTIASTPSLLQAGIQYHGGPVMAANTTVYPIFYGTWPVPAASATPSFPTIVNDFLTGFSFSSRNATNSTYTDGKGTPLSAKYATAATYSDTTYKYGKSLTDNAIGSIVTDAIAASKLPPDSNGQYVVLTAPDVTLPSGFLTKYCGWHTYGTLKGVQVKFAFVGDASAKLSACSAQTVTSPNGNPAADAAISVLAHEMDEMTTDPQMNAWFDAKGQENADKCAWTFGPLTKTVSGYSNLTLGTKNYLVQQNWKNAAPSGICGMS